MEKWSWTVYVLNRYIADETELWKLLRSLPGKIKPDWKKEEMILKNYKSVTMEFYLKHVQKEIKDYIEINSFDHISTVFANNIP